MPEKGQQHPYESSRELQRKLYLAAKAKKERRFHALYDRIFRSDILWRAWMEVKKNGGSPGIDGVSIDDVERSGVQEFLDKIEGELKTGKYRTQAVLRVYIAKPDGRCRPLGIPTVKDRIIQQACKIVIEPIFEADFQNCSYGFRPKHDAQQAVLAAKETLLTGWYVMDADIESYFDNVDQEILMSLLKRRISDRRILKLILKWLKAGVVENGKKTSTDKGAPQGGVISPLLANIYLHVMDTYWIKECKQLGQLIRYCDDFVIICRTFRDALKSKRIVEAILKRLKLTLHPTKTRVLYTRNEGFDFLGFHFHKLKAKTNGKLYPYIWPRQKAMKSIRETIRERTERSTQCKTVEMIIKELNPIIRGWRNYFKIGNSAKQLEAMDNYVRYRLWRWLRKRHIKKRSEKVRQMFKTWFPKCGVEKFHPKGICKALS
jgi:RNA-directed DNA polymerase